MFIQVIQAPIQALVQASIQGPAGSADALRAASYRWTHELGSTSIGWLGCTSGVTEDGTFFSAERFESEQKAILEGGRPGRRRWWTEMSRNLTGEVTFVNCRDVEVYAPDPTAVDKAGYVQIVQGRVKDATLMRALLRSMAKEMSLDRQDLLGSTLALHPDDGYTHILYFTSEDDALAAEDRETPPRIKSIMDTIYELHVTSPRYHLLTAPWIHSRRETR